MRFGINSLLFSDTFDAVDLPLLAHCRELGFEVIEIYPGVLETFPAREVREIAGDLGMSVIINYALPETANPISPDPSVRRRGVDLSKQLVDICNEVGAEIYCGANYAAWRYFTGKRRSNEEWEWGVSGFEEIADYARDRSDLLLAVEVLNRFESHFLNTVADAVRFVGQVGHDNVKVHLDTFHMIREEDDMRSAIAGCGSRIGYFHACGSQRGVPGRDLVPWRETFEALRDSGYSGPITIESFDPDGKVAPLVAVWREFADSPEQLASEGLAFLKRLHSDIYEAGTST